MEEFQTCGISIFFALQNLSQRETIESKYINASMQKVRTFLQLIRWPNLVMVVLIMGACYGFMLDPTKTTFRIPEFVLVMMVTVIIAASGYVINDYYDMQTDQINKPRQWIAGNTLSLSSIMWIYRYLVIAGGIVAAITAIWMGLLPYFLLYPLAIGGLWLYSFSLKCRPVVGNLWVSLFCGGVVLIVALPDVIRQQSIALKPTLWYLAFFAFQTTWYREIVKDLEDQTGDKDAGCKTLPVRYGVLPAKIMAIVVALGLMASLYGWDISGPGTYRLFIFTLLQGALVGSMGLVWWAKDPSYFRHASTLIKCMMLAGTVLMLT